MKLTIKDAGKPARTDLLALLLPEGVDPEVPSSVDVPDSFLTNFEAKPRARRSTYSTGGQAKEVLLVGLGAADSIDAEGLRRAAAVAVKDALSRKVKSIHIEVDGMVPWRRAETAAMLSTRGNSDEEWPT